MTSIEIFQRGKWVAAAAIQELATDRCRLEYLPEYQFSEDPQPISLTLPLDAPPDVMLPVDGGALEGYDRRPAPFLYDLVPQGRGRQYLLKLLGLTDSDQMIMPLLKAGAFNPIGCLRLRSAVDFYRTHTSTTGNSAMEDGFSLNDILKKSEGFLEHLAMHAMLAAGTTGVQGVAPKYLLTQNGEGQWFADLALDDTRAKAHWLIKLPRGKSEDDRAVLRNEAAYLRVAAAVGLRTHESPVLHGEMLFVRRFDRALDGHGLHRLHQESVASLAGVRGFGMPLSMPEMLAAIRAHVSDPLAETIEFLKRDALNTALRNTDNHARNTAVQKLPDGQVRLTPLYDFAPMFMDPEIVPRSAHWDMQGRRLTDYRQIVSSLGETLPPAHGRALSEAMSAFSDQIGRLPSLAKDLGVETWVLEQCKHAIDRVATELCGINVPPQRPRSPKPA